MTKTMEQNIRDVVAEMKQKAKSSPLFDGEEVGEPLIRGSQVCDWADRIEEALGTEKGGALRHCGYTAEDAANGDFDMKLLTPYEGATIRAALWPVAHRQDCRDWLFLVLVLNNRGIGWSIRGQFDDCGRFVAKGMLRSMALELRRAYCHRGKKCRKRAIARAVALEAARD